MIKLPVQIKSTFFYILTSLFTKGLSVISTPIFTNIMTPEEIGQFSEYTSWKIFFALFACFSLNTGSFSLAMSEYSQAKASYQSSILALSMLIAGILLFLVIIFSDQLESIVGLEKQLLYLMFTSFLVVPAIDFWTLRMKYEYSYKKVAFVTFMLALFSLFFSILGVLFSQTFLICPAGEARIYGTEIIYILFALVLSFFIFKEGKIFFKYDYWKFGILLSAPLLVHAVAHNFMTVADRLIIENILGRSELGIYSIINSTSSMVLIVWYAINISLIPLIFKKLKTQASDHESFFSLLQTIIIGYSLIVFLTILICPEIVMLLATNQYMNYIHILPPLAISTIYTAIYNTYSNIFLFYKKTCFIVIGSLISGAISMLLNFIFIKKYGIVAAAYVNFSSFLLLSIILLFFSNIFLKKDILSKKFHLTMLFMNISWIFISLFLYNFTILRYFVALALFIIICLFCKKHIVSFNNSIVASK